MYAAVNAACSYAPLVVHPGETRKADWNTTVAAELRHRALAGDWLVARGYKFSDHIVTTATLTPFSHVAIYEQSQNGVIEAEAKGVHASTLVDFIDKSQHIVLIRPKWHTADTGPLAIDKARALLGRHYDFLGTTGIDVADRFYCSELAIAAYQPWHSADEFFPKVIKPAEMHRWGRVIYDTGGFDGSSGPRK